MYIKCTNNHKVFAVCSNIPAAWNVTSALNQTLKEGDTINLTCVENFTNVGSELVTCVKGETFNFSRLPKCVEGKIA